MASTPISSRSSVYGGKTSRARRLRSFALPDGQEVHVALSPEEANSLRQRLAAVKQDQPFELVIHGSAEHLEALRRAHSHHEARREDLRQQHGDTYDEFERIRNELDSLSTDLHMLSDHAVHLDANFSKYGYSAHLRTYDDPPESSRTSLSGHDHDEHDHEPTDWEAERRSGKIFKLYKKPTVRQYFHRGLLWRASRTTEVATFELFFDLLYVGIIAINGDSAAEMPTGEELLRYTITFVMSWRIWSDLSVLVSWFETDDILQRISALFIMACLVGLTTNMLEALQECYTQLVAFYLAARLFVAFYYLLLACIVPMVRGMMVAQAVIVFVPSALWIGSVYVEMPQRLAVIFVSLFLDLFASIVSIFLARYRPTSLPKFSSWAERVFEFYPATNIEHKTERTNAFVTLIFGYSVVALLYQNTASFGVNVYYGKAVLGLIQAFCFNTLYFEIDGDSLWQHAIRRSAFSAVTWTSIHLPFLLAYSLAGASLSKLVVAHDLPGADSHSLLEMYMEKSEEDINIGLRWFYCAGLGIALASMGVISLSHIHKDIDGTRIRKYHRLANRFAVCIILFCLPLAHDLNSLSLISITTALIFWVLLLELYGSSCPKESFFGEKATCKYTARCKVRKKDMELAVKHGHMINLRELSGGEKGLYDLS